MKGIRFLSTCVAIVLVSSLATKSSAQTIPFFITGSGDVIGGLLPLVPGIAVDHNTQAGWGTKIGVHTGEGAFKLVAPPDFATLTADFSSDRPYRFTSALNPNNVLACNYGVTTGDLPAAKPGKATFYSIGQGADPDSPIDDTFIIAFLAEFRPALDECSGKFDRRRLKNGSFMMLAISGPVVIDFAQLGVVNADAPGDPIPYSWLGIGTLTFKWPFGLF